MHFASYMNKIVDVTVRKQNLNHWPGDEDQLPAYKYVKNLESNLIRLMKEVSCIRYPLISFLYPIFIRATVMLMIKKNLPNLPEKTF